MELTERRQKILSSIVNSYIENGEPVGSMTIAREIGVSSATIRNEMMELVHLGLLEQPHTSAGRVPSEKGYRQFVSSLPDKKRLSQEDRTYFDSVLYDNAYEIQRLLKSVMELLAGYAKCVSVVSTPNGSAAKVKGVQFVQISRRAAMLILMSSAGTVKSRIFQCDFDLTTEIVRMFFRIFNERLAGMPVAEINVAFIQSMGASLGELSMLSASALVALLEVTQETMQTEMLMNGQMNLLFYPELAQDEVRDMIRFLEDREQVKRLLKKVTKKTTVLIGGESDCPALHRAAVVAKGYRINGDTAGVMAVIGPMRMNYLKLMAALEYLENQVSQMLCALTTDS